MGSVIYERVSLITTNTVHPAKRVERGGRYVFTVTGNFDGATVDLIALIEGHAAVTILDMAATASSFKPVFIPCGTWMQAAIIGGGGNHTAMDASLTFVD